MARRVLAACIVVLAACSLLAACSTAPDTTTTAGAGAKATTKTTQAPTSSTSTSTTLSVETWPPVSYDQGTPGFTYAGGWTYSSAASALRGSFLFAEKAGATLTFRFIGNYVAWLAKTADVYGKAVVTVDDQEPVTVDLYSKSPMWRHLVWETKDLALGEHTVKIECTGKKRTAAKGICINVDSIEIVGALIGRYQQSNESFTYAGTWKTSKSASAYGGSFALAKTSGSRVTVKFTGVQIDWYAKQGPPYGKAQVILDGGKPVTIDLYSPDEQWKQNVWSSGRLAMGPHTLVIKWTGSKNSKAEGTYVNVDAFEIAGKVTAVDPR
jgi:predicted small secreted protein